MAFASIRWHSLALELSHKSHNLGTLLERIVSYTNSLCDRICKRSLLINSSSHRMYGRVSPPVEWRSSRFSNRANRTNAVLDIGIVLARHTWVRRFYWKASFEHPFHSKRFHRGHTETGVQVTHELHRSVLLRSIYWVSAASTISLVSTHLGVLSIATWSYPPSGDTRILPLAKLIVLINVWHHFNFLSSCQISLSIQSITITPLRRTLLQRTSVSFVHEPREKNLKGDSFKKILFGGNTFQGLREFELSRILGKFLSWNWPKSWSDSHSVFSFFETLRNRNLSPLILLPGKWKVLSMQYSNFLVKANEFELDLGH